jgi:hypothetical protein
MHNFTGNYNKILEVLEREGKSLIDSNGNFFKKNKKPKLSDIELSSMVLAAEYMGIDSENYLFKYLKGTPLSEKIERSVYNRRKRNTSFYLNMIREKLASKFNEFEDYFIVDSMPLEVCKNSRVSRSNICKNNFETAPDRGFCASQQMHYYGYKLHAVCSVSGVFQSFDISKASVHDIHYLKNIKYQLNNCTILADKGYLSSQYQLDLFHTVNIDLQTPMRKNQKDYIPQPYIFRKSRKRIETLFSQLCDQFMIRRNYAKSFDGFKTRILAKITSLTMIQFINKFVFDRSINNLKVNIA